MKREEIEEWLRLASVPGIGPKRFGGLISKFGTPQKVFSASSDELSSVPGMDKRVVSSILQGGDRGWVREEISRMEAKGIDLLTISDTLYPNRLRQIYDPPPLLYLRGELTKGDNLALAIVGSRLATIYGRLVTERLALQLAKRGITIVSGLARGIDSSAHRGALKAGGRTIAVLGCGVDVIYPPENEGLMNQITTSGAVISEFPLGSPPEAGNFPQRNRLISGLSLGVIVVEAGQRSGALITAQCALDQGREVFAIPGNINARTSKGTNQLIKEGAKLVDGVDDILEELGMASSPSDDSPPPKLEGDEATLFELLSSEPIHVDRIIRQTGYSSPQVLSLLLSLELKGLVRQLSGKLFVRA